MKLEDIRKLLEETEGRIFSVIFRKRTPPHDIRTMLCRTGVKKGLTENPSKPGVDAKKNKLVVVWDMQESAYRSIPIEGVLSIKIGGEWIEVANEPH